MTARTLFSLLALSLCSTGCIELEVQKKKSVQEYRAGGGWGCPTCDFRNSPHLGRSMFNGASIELVGVGTDASQHEPRFVGAVAASGTSGAVLVDEQGLGIEREEGEPLRGEALVGWTLLLDLPEVGVVGVDVDAFEWVEDWTRAHHLIPTYGLSYVERDSGERVSVCPGLEPGETTTVLLPGERYDLRSSDGVVAAPQGVTIACRGHALAKMKLLGYDPRSAHRDTSAKERVATLRMLTADYCGTGESYTEEGTPLDWSDARGFVGLERAGVTRTIEARWTSEGASCLNEPRVDGMRIACDLPRCDPADEGHGAATWITRLP